MSDTFWGGYSNALGAIAGVGQQVTNRRAGANLRNRDYGGAAGAMFDGGNVQGGLALQNAGIEQEQAARARQAAATLKITGALRDVRARGGNVVEALDAFAPQIRQMGVGDGEIGQIRTILERDPNFVDELARLAGAEADQYDIRNSGEDIVAVNKRTLSPTTVVDRAPEPYFRDGMLFIPPSSGAAAGSPSQPAPMTGGAISDALLYSPSSMVGITAQSESGNRERDANGNLITSPAGAQGRMQVMPGTNRDPGYGVTPARDNSDAERTRVGEEYLAAMMQEYGGDPAKAWAAYNWGPGNLDRAIAQYGGDWLNHAPAETQNYVSSNLRALNGSGVPVEAQGGEASQETGAQPLAGGWTMQAVETPAQRRQAERDREDQRRWEIQNARQERSSAPVRTLTPAEVAAQGLPEGTVAQQQANGSINVVSRGGTERYTQDQRQSAGFAYRLQNAAGSLDRLAQSGTARPSAAILAFGDGRIQENALSSTDRRWLQAAREWLAPVLRKDTGAAVGPGELVTYMGIYLPSPTDDAATLAQKAQARRTAEEALRAQAGGAYTEMFPQAGGQQNGRRRTNAPGLPFNINDAQLRTRQIYSRAGDPGQPRGSELNPIWLNPEDPNSGWTNARSGQYIVRLDGRVVQKP